MFLLKNVFGKTRVPNLLSKVSLKSSNSEFVI